jgi:20S proteasome subunit alpha 7
MLKGREEAAQYKQMFGISIPGATIADRLALKAQMNTIYSSYRPFGSTMLLCCHDNMNGASLWMIEPSGSCY